MKRVYALLVALVATMQLAMAQYPIDSEQAVVPLKALSFDYDEVHLLDGPFMNAMQVNQQWLKNADEKRFLHNFRVTAGLKTDAMAFEGWEALDIELRGHTLGHLLSAYALMYGTTGQEFYKEKSARFVAGLAECQEALGSSGYLSAFPEMLIDRAIQGKQVWAPWYTLHKIYQGMLDQYVICGNTQAYEVLKKMCDWAYNKLKPLSQEELNRMLLNEFGGMEETLYNVYGVTKDERHKELAYMFRDYKIFDPLTRREDKLGGNHANTQIPKAIGEARGYELTGDTSEHGVAKFFWQTVIKNHTYVTGGNSDSEYFGEAGKLSTRLGQNTTETCNTYNMLKLTRHLFIWEASPEYAEYYERALFNHILSSQDPVTGGVTYFHTLHPGSAKDFNRPFHDFTCCCGTAYESHSKYGEAIYYKSADQKGLYVNLFIASELNWQDKGFGLKQETNFPEESSTKLTVTVEQPTNLTIYMRYPKWAVSGITIKVNGKKIAVKGKPGSYVAINRTWKSGDVIESAMPMSLHTEYMPDNKQVGAILYGPIVLAAELGKEQLDETFGVPVFVNVPKKLTDWIKPVEGKPMTFKTVGVGRPNEALLSPLYKINDQRYSVYFDFFTEEDWTNKQEEYKRKQAEEKAIADRTVDWIGVGESQSERDHNVESMVSYVYQQGGKMGRDVRIDGYIRYDVKVNPNRKNQLMLTYWGGDTDVDYKIYIDGNEALYVKMVELAPAGQFKNHFFDIPEEFTKGKERVEIRFVPIIRSAPTYGIRVLNKS